MCPFTSLQDRIVREISSTYTSIEEYKNYTRKNVLHNKLIDRKAAEKRIQIVEDKLKALKIILAKIDNSNYERCLKCEKPIPLSVNFLKKSKFRICEECLN